MLLSQVHLEQRLAFDLASALIGVDRAREQPVLLVASNLAVVQEMLLRNGGTLTVAVETGEMLARARALVEGQAWQGRVELIPAETLGRAQNGRFRGAIWASPQRPTQQRRLAELALAVATGGLLTILVGGWMAGFLRASRCRAASSQPQWPGRSFRQELARAGFAAAHTYMLGGTRSATYAVLARLAERARRPDLADRAEVAYRQTLAQPEKLGLASLELLCVRREAGS